MPPLSLNDSKERMRKHSSCSVHTHLHTLQAPAGPSGLPGLPPQPWSLCIRQE